MSQGKDEALLTRVFASGVPSFPFSGRRTRSGPIPGGKIFRRISAFAIFRLGYAGSSGYRPDATGPVGVGASQRAYYSVRFTQNLESPPVQAPLLIRFGLHRAKGGRIGLHRSWSSWPLQVQIWNKKNRPIKDRLSLPSYLPPFQVCWYRWPS